MWHPALCNNTRRRMSAPVAPPSRPRRSPIPAVIALLLLCGAAAAFGYSVMMYHEATSLPMDCRSYALEVPKGDTAEHAAEALRKRFDGVAHARIEGAKEQMIVVRVQGGKDGLVKALLVSTDEAYASRAPLSEPELGIAKARVKAAPLLHTLKIQIEEAAPPIVDPSVYRGRGTAALFYGIALAVAAGATLLWGRR